MTTYRNHLGRVTATVRKKGHPSQSKTFNTRKQAEKWAKALESDLIREKHNLDKYEHSILEWWRTELGSKYLVSLRKKDFKDARAKLLATKKHKRIPDDSCTSDECNCPTLKPATINRRVALISRAISVTLEDEDWLTRNPARIGNLTEDNQREVLLEPDEVKRLLAAAKAHDEPCIHAMIVVAMASGARAGELQSLKWQDINLDRGTARLLRTKNGDTRVIPIRGFALDTLKELPRKLDDDHVFWNSTGHSPIYYRKAWGEIRDAAGLSHVRFHDLRHLAASHMAMAGVSLREIAEVLGHRSLQMVQRYSHFLDDHIAAVGDKVAESVFH